jgi:hypothetical protein
MAIQWPAGTQIVFPDAEQRATERANLAAQQAYNRARLNLESEQMALSKAQQAWTEQYQTAQLTGFFQGQPTMAARQFWAQEFGGYEQPQAGQTTLDLEQQRWAQAQGLANAFGTWYRPGTQPVPGQTTLAQQAQAFSQAATQFQQQRALFEEALSAQREAREAQAQQQEQAQQYLNLLAGLRGPADWAKYQQVLGATPGGIRDLVAASMGQYLPGGGATTGMQPTPVSLQSMYQDVSGQPWMGGTSAWQAAGMTGTPPPGGGTWNQAWGITGSPISQITTSANPTMQIAGPGGLTPEQMSRIQQSAEARWGVGEWRQWLFEDLVNRGTPVERAISMAVNGAVPESTVQEIINASGINATVVGGQNPQPAGGPGSPTATSLNPYYVPPGGTQQSGLNPYYFSTGGAVGQPGALAAGPQGGTQPTQGFPAPQTIGTLPLPNQIAPQTWANLAPSQQQLLLGAYEAQGWHPQDVLTLFNQSLPRYATNAPMAGTFRLQG